MNRIIIVLIGVVLSLSICAQNGENVPYTRYGLGTVTGDNLYHLRSMGSLGSSYNSVYFINIANPASYSHLLATAFDVGVYGQNTRLSTSKANKAKWSGNLEYFALAMPLYNPLNRILDREEKDYSLGLAVALKPYSKVFYNVAVRDSIDNIGRLVRNYKGNGNINEFIGGLSGKYKDISAGINVKYVFGSVDYKNRTFLLDHQSTAYANVFNKEYNMNGFAFQAGLQYSLDLTKAGSNSTYRGIDVGVTYTGASSFNTSSDSLLTGELNLGRGGVFVDTLAFASAVKGSGKLPSKIGLGINYREGNKFLVGVDYEYTPWSQYRNNAVNQSSGGMQDAYRVSLGGYYRPNYKSYSNYMKRIYYRAGFLYEKDGRVIAGKQLDHMAVTFGLGLPFSFQRKISNANIGVELGIRGRNSPIKEEYIKFTLSFNFSDDEWFLKSRYN